MKIFFAVIVLVSLACFEAQTTIKNYTLEQKEDYDCVKCLCHAVSGCYFRRNCAKYSIDMVYWRRAGGLSPTHSHPSPDEEARYKSCMMNENCIAGTIIEYTQSFGRLDCNCDGVFDCKDRAAIHRTGENCGQPQFDEKYRNRFNSCGRSTNLKTMLASEFTSYCQVEPF